MSSEARGYKVQKRGQLEMCKGLGEVPFSAYMIGHFVGHVSQNVVSEALHTHQLTGNPGWGRKLHSSLSRKPQVYGVEVPEPRKREYCFRSHRELMAELRTTSLC